MAARRSSHAVAAPQRTQGFTLVEMLTVLTIVAIGLAVAMPSLRAAVVGQRVRATATDLMSSLLLARSEAIKRNDQVRLEPLTPEDWTSGWRAVGVAARDQIDRKGLIGDGVAFARAPLSLVYERHGRLSDPGLLRFEIVDTVSGANSRCLTIDSSGLPRVANGACP